MVERQNIYNLSWFKTNLIELDLSSFDRATGERIYDFVVKYKPPGFTGMYRNLQKFTGFDRFLQTITQIYRFLHKFTENIKIY